MQKPEPFVKPDTIFSVTDAASLLKGVVETAFPRIKIRGELFKALSEMDYNKNIEPFMLLSFMTLIVIPDAKLNHKGLFGVSKWNYLYKG